MNIETIDPPETGRREPCVPERHPVTVLSGIYLDFGLPLTLAAGAAIADYELFEEELLAASYSNALSR